VAHGHIKDLIDKSVDAIFLPSFINFNPDSASLRSFACPYAQSMPYIADLAFEGIKLLKPVVNLELGKNYLINELYKSLKRFRISKKAITNALNTAEKKQEEFSRAVKNRGREILENIPERTIVIVGRAYNAFDPGINLEIPKKLSALGVFSIPMDFLALDAIDISARWSNMYWRSGQSILKAAEIIRDDPRLFALCIGNFSCGPDSFINRFFDETMGGKPFLQIEIDEHSADAGVITRCEAFLDSIGSRKEIPVNKPEKINILTINKGTKNKIVYIPRMSDHAFGLKAAFETCGLDAEVLSIPDAETVKIGRRYVSGKECYPCAITMGDMVKKTMSDSFDPERAVFFMPSGAGPCRFGQYNILQRLVLDEIGLNKVPIFAPNQDESFYSDLGIVGDNFSKQAWKGVMAIDLLLKCLHETRPYEINKGETDRIYNKYLERLTVSLRHSNGSSFGLLHDIRRSFYGIKKNKAKRPLIGLIGEVFVRQNTFSNEDIIRRIEDLGGEVWRAPFEEWIYYINLMGMRKSYVRLRNNMFSRKDTNDLLSSALTRYVQKKVEHRFARPFKGFLRTLHEPSTSKLLKNASPYVHDSFEGETVLSIGKAVDLAEKGASGIISAIPFGCMPGTIVGALLKGIKQDTGTPCMSVSYDGSEAACSEIQLEAFMHQASEYMSAGNGKKVSL
jgi:predicted nucleotide-binding protein (sugar kinase/HSP70/actin superfamily)